MFHGIVLIDSSSVTTAMHCRQEFKENFYVLTLIRISQSSLEHTHTHILEQQSGMCLGDDCFTCHGANSAVMVLILLSWEIRSR